MTALVFSLTAFQVLASNTTEHAFNLNVDLTVYNAVCGQGGNGAVTTTVSGGVPPYTYLWSNGETTTGIVNLGPGTYSVTVTDAAGNTDSETATVIEESPIDLQLNASYETCDGSCDGNVSVNASGGTPPYSYLWNTGDTFVVVYDACAGIYTVTVTDANGCTAEGSIELELSPEGIWLMMSSTPVSCQGANDGTVHVSVMTGVAPYTYEWDSPLIGDSPDGAGLPAGTYCVTVTDVNDCSNSMCVDVEDSMDPCPCDVSGTYTVTNAGCGLSNGTIDLTVTGGLPGYMFAWSNGAVSEDLSDLAPGEYTVTVTDSGVPACEIVVGPITVGENCPCDIPTSYIATDSDCGANNGSIDITVSGSGGYGFIWSHGPVTEDVSGLAPGEYTVTITDTLGVACDTIIGPITINEDCCVTPVIASVVVVESECMLANGSATITMVGNNDDFEFAWDPDIGTCNNATCNARTNLPAGTYSVTITNANDPQSICDSIVEVFTIGNIDSPVTTIVSQTPATCNQPNGTVTMSPVNFDYVWCNGETGNNPTMLMAGMCTVTVTDPDTGCTDAFTVVIDEVNPLMLDISVDNYPDCGMANGSVSTTVTDGSTNYGYAWSDGATTPDRTGLSAGIYCLTVTDLGITGCVRDTCFVLVDNIVEGATITVDEPVSISCAGADDATATYTVDYHMDFAFPADTTIINASTGDTVSNENLAPGDYCIIVSDANNCIAGQACFTVEDVSQIDVDVAIDNTCETGPAIWLVDVSGGNGGYTYEWSNGDMTQNLEDPGEGTYSVTVSDSNGCTAFAENLVLIDTCDCPQILIQSVVVINAECGLDNGSATIEMVGNNAIYGYEWTPDVSNTNSADNLPAGTYEVEISLLNNPHNCPPIKEVFTVGSPVSEIVEITTTPDTCNAGLGSATLMPDTLVYEWSNMFTGHSQTGLQAGEYYVTVTDTVENCVGALTVVIDNINTLGIDIQVNNYPDCGEANGSVTVTPQNGVGPYAYNWSDGATDQARDDLAAGIYCLTVSDLSGTCVADTCFVLTNVVEGGATIEIETPISVSCIGDANGMVNYTVTYDPVFNHPADTSIVHTGSGDEYNNGELAPGDYCIIIFDADSCYAGANCFTVEEPSQIDVDLAIDNDCTTGPAIHIVETTGGTPGYTYDWADIPGTDNPEDRPDLDGGTYDVTITDSHGCTAFAGGLIVIDTCACPPLAISSVVVVEEECGMTDGKVTVNVVGAGPGGVIYTWSTPGGAGNVAENLSAGYYSVTIADADRPELCFIVEELTIGTITGPDAGYTATPASCMGSDGSATFDNPALNYKWEDGEETISRDDLVPGFHSVTITDPADPACPNVTTVVIGENPAEFTITPIVTHPTGCNDENGVVTLEVSPAGSYSFSWGPSNTMDNIAPGVYEVTVTDDATGCTKETYFVLSNFNTQLIITINGEIELSCPGDTDGTLDFTLAGDIISQPLDTAIVDMSGNEMQNGSLTAGYYCLVISDMNGCFLNAECFEVKDPEQIDVDIAVFDENCDSLGSIVLVEVIGGAAGYEYTWTPPISIDSTAYNLAAGSYAVTVTDDNECEVFETLDVEEDPDQIDLEVIDITLCRDSLVTPGDQIDVTPAGADITVTDMNGDPVDIDLPVLPDGETEYVVQVVSGACVTFDTLIVSIAPEINMAAEQDSTFCEESSAPVELTAGCDNCDVNDIVWNTLPSGTEVGQGPVLQNPNDPGMPMEEGVYEAVYIDDFGCEDRDTVQLSLFVRLDIPPVEDLICKGDSTFLSIDFPADPDLYIWEWSGDNIKEENQNEIIACPTESSLYYVIYTDLEHGCETLDSIPVEVIDLDYVEITTDSTEICIYESTQLNVTEVPGGIYEWRPEESLDFTDIYNPVASPLETTTYTVTVTDENECSVERGIEIIVTRPACAPPYVFLPNAFTPNGDGKNDVLYLRGTDITDVHLIIYNRWGEKMFETNSQSIGWDGTFRGKELGADVYGYYLTVRCGNGDQYKEKGNVTILK